MDLDLGIIQNKYNRQDYFSYYSLSRLTITIIVATTTKNKVKYLLSIDAAFNIVN